MVGYGFVSLVHNVRQVFFEAGGECTACFTNVQFAAFEAVDDVDDVLSLTVEVFCDVEL